MTLGPRCNPGKGLRQTVMIPALGPGGSRASEKSSLGAGPLIQYLGACYTIARGAYGGLTDRIRPGNTRLGKTFGWYVLGRVMVRGPRVQRLV